MDEIADIKRRAGIVEFAPSPDFDGSGRGQSDPESGPSISEQLQSVATSTQGVGRIDQTQIEVILRAAEMLKKMGK